VDRVCISTRPSGLPVNSVPANEKPEALSSKSLEELTTLLASMKKLHNLTDVDTKDRVIRAIEIEMVYHDQGLQRTIIRPSESLPGHTVLSVLPNTNVLPKTS
jgi:hypothetical protein